MGCSIEELSELNDGDDESVNDAKLWGTIVAVVGTAFGLTWLGATSVRRLVKAELDSQAPDLPVGDERPDLERAAELVVVSASGDL